MASEMQPDLLIGLPESDNHVAASNGITHPSDQSDESNLEPAAPNGNNGNGMSNKNALQSVYLYSISIL